MMPWITIVFDQYIYGDQYMLDKSPGSDSENSYPSDFVSPYGRAGDVRIVHLLDKARGGVSLADVCRQEGIDEQSVHKFIGTWTQELVSVVRILHDLDFPVVRISPDNSITFMNDTFLEYAGVDDLADVFEVGAARVRERHLGIDLLSLFVEKDRKRFEGLKDTARIRLNDEKAVFRVGVHNEFTFVSLRGIPIPVRLGMTYVAGSDSFLITMVDTTEIREYEQALREMSERYQTLIELSPDAIIVTNADMDIVYASDSAAEMLNIEEPSDIVGVDLRELVVPEERAWAEQNLAQMLIGTHPVPHQYTIMRPDETWFVGEMNSALLRDVGGNPMGTISVVRDMADRERAEHEHEQLQERVRQAQKLESLAKMAGGVAHHINNVLQAISANVELALEQPDSVPVRDYLVSIREAQRQAAVISNQLLAYSGRGGYIVQGVDLNVVLTEVGDLLRYAIAPGVKIEYSLMSEVACIRADHVQLHQALFNLLRNAVEAIDGTGTITVATGEAPFEMEPGATYHTTPTGISRGQESIYVRIADDGEGMTAETCSRMFDPFFSTREVGRGLGLAAVLGIVRAHEGALSVLTSPGEGSEFKLFFPKSGVENPADAVDENRGKRQHDGLILVVDDEDLVLDSTRAMLEFSGYRVLTARHGRDAVRLVETRANEIDLVVLDLVMPDMDGVEVLERMREIVPDIPVVVASGYSEDEISVRFSGHGLHGRLQKPYTMQSLKVAIGAVLDTP
jgi:PAS domain S-box-containing protein